MFTVSRYLYFLLLFFISLPIKQLYAQDLAIDGKNQLAFKNQTRSISGNPGSKYWQNTAVYDIDVSFDPTNLEVRGKMKINYINNSPDILNKLVFKLYPNLYKGNSMRNVNISEKDLSQGVHIKSVQIDGEKIEYNKIKINGTNMTMGINPALSGSTTTIEIDYAYTLNEGSFIRTGKIADNSFFIAYFFPRIAVYDDIDGWNEFPYLGKEEFYNDFCDFNIKITVPGDFQVWATGDLKNRKELFQQPFLDRIQQAEISDDIIDIISEEDLKEGHITFNNPSNTWFFQAKNVTDFAFAISNNYVWKASSIVVDRKEQRRTTVNAVFSADHSNYIPVVDYARKTVELMSNKFPAVPFPYPHITIVDGRDAMEYPMMVNNLPFEDKKEMIQLTSHEVFHSLFPFYVGTNETKHSFMDEGWSTMAEFMFLPDINSSLDSSYDLSSINDYAGSTEDMPVMTPTPQLYGKARFADKDLKPALSLYYLKEMLGDELFLKGMKFFITTWSGKHPTPYDFFNCFNTAVGKNLNWFWNSWYLIKSIPDLKIGKVAYKWLDYKIEIMSPGNAVMPIHLTVFYENGSQAKIIRNVGIWENGMGPVYISFKAKRKVTKIILGETLDADIDPSDNVWIP